MSGEQAFSSSWSISETTGAGTEARAGARVSRIVLRIRCKLFLEYLKTSVARTTATRSFAPKDLVGCLENSDLEDGKES